MLASTKNKLILSALIVVVVFWIALAFLITPEEIIASIGIHNAYLIVFLLAAIGGLSTITGTSLFAAIATFASGGADPWALGMVGGLGIFISDSVFFLIARRGAQALEAKPNGIRHRLANVAQRIPLWGLQSGVYVYVGVTPLPNDILMGALALAQVRYHTIAPALLAGSITIATLTAHIGDTFFF